MGHIRIIRLQWRLAKRVNAPARPPQPGHLFFNERLRSTAPAYGCRDWNRHTRPASACSGAGVAGPRITSGSTATSPFASTCDWRGHRRTPWGAAGGDDDAAETPSSARPRPLIEPIEGKTK